MASGHARLHCRVWFRLDALSGVSMMKQTMQTTVRMSADLYEMLKAAAGEEASMGEEIRRRLEASFGLNQPRLEVMMVNPNEVIVRLRASQ
jgi:hypothetical protein